MVTEDPPRHSKSPDEPVTIEGTAERIPETGDNSALSAEQVAATQQETTDSVTPQNGEPTPDDSGETTVADAQMPPVAEDFADRQNAEETVASAQEDASEDIAAAKSGERDPAPASTWSQRPVESSPPPKQTSASVLIAAGIFGGLVALACAGAMQYAGYLPAATPAAPAADTAALSADIDSLRQQIASLPTATAPATDPALEQRIAKLESKLGPIENGLDKTRSELAAATEAMQSAQSGSGDVTARLDQIEKKLQEPQNDGAVARTIAATALRAAIDRGGPFTTELDALASVSDRNASVDELRTLASGGVLSRDTLVERFPDVAFAMIDAVNRPGPDSGIAQRLLSSAMSIVKVRDVGDVEGDGVEAITARIEERLKAGDLKAAAGEWEKLPEPAKAAGAAFKAELDKRIHAEDLLSAVMAAMNKQS